MNAFWWGFIIGPFACALLAYAACVVWCIVKPRRYPAWLFGHETVYNHEGRQGPCLHQHVYRKDRWPSYRMAAWHAGRSTRRCHEERLRGIDNYAKYDPDYSKAAP